MRIGDLWSVERAVLRRRPWPVQFALVAAGLALATASRWLLDRGANGVPFATFLPFVVLAAGLLDWPFAVLMTLGSMVIVRLLFLDWHASGVVRVTLSVGFVASAAIIVVLGQVMRRTMFALQRQARETALLNQEIQHRAKNALQMVSSMAYQAKHATSPEQFYEDLTGRIGALVRANDYLGLTAHRSGDLARLVELSITPFDRSRIQFAGPPCMVEGPVGVRLMMVLHELGTNATKYGSLSVPQGRVDLLWTVEDSQASLRWLESGGPAVNKPSRRGFGSRLLSATAPLSNIQVDYAPQGVQCTIEFRAKQQPLVGFVPA